MAVHPVYEGVKSFYKEEDETVPVNVYGKSKVAAEQFISTNFSNYAILRSSIIIGPQAISPVPKSLPIQVHKLVSYCTFARSSSFFIESVETAIGFLSWLNYKLRPVVILYYLFLILCFLLYLGPDMATYEILCTKQLFQQNFQNLSTKKWKQKV